MPKICYIQKNFRREALFMIDRANEIIEEYQIEGLKLTLRQLYYQFVSRDWLPNQQKEYKRLGKIISDARLAGLVDWTAIEDRTRNLTQYYHNTDPGDAVQDALRYFSLDKWQDQEYRPEVWIEKEALIGVISGICKALDVPCFACKGYVSSSEMWDAAGRFQRYETEGQTPVIIHLGDHDPSGVDMTRDIADRLDLFMGGLKVERIALNYDQIEEYAPPPNPVKFKDPRSANYPYRESWELDALEPKILQGLIRNTVANYMDFDILENIKQTEKEYRKILENIVDNWSSL